jgi:hypothetical protein
LTSPLFVIATRDELWSRGALLESRRGCGEARSDGRGSVARDACDLSLRERCDSRFAPLREIARGLTDARVRIVASVRSIGGSIVDEETLTIGMRGVSIVTTPEHAAEDAAHLRALVAIEPEATVGKAADFVWLGGSGAVLLHEAIGHAAEHEHPRDRVPPWLSVHDEPPFAVDDTGAQTATTDLLRQPPRCLRRESFRDVPLPRMTALVARQDGAPFALPPSRIDIHLLAGGAYDPLTEVVTINVAIADRIDGQRVTRLQPFVIRESRDRVLASIAGATGHPIRYPGVVCSREGQELVVASHAPIIVMRMTRYEVRGTRYEGLMPNVSGREATRTSYLVPRTWSALRTVK